MRRKLAIAGVEGSPPPGNEEATIPRLLRERRTAQERVKRLEEALRHCAVALEADWADGDGCSLCHSKPHAYDCPIYVARGALAAGAEEGAGSLYVRIKAGSGDEAQQEERIDFSPPVEALCLCPDECEVHPGDPEEEFEVNPGDPEGRRRQ